MGAAEPRLLRGEFHAVPDGSGTVRHANAARVVESPSADEVRGRGYLLPEAVVRAM